MYENSNIPMNYASKVLVKNGTDTTEALIYMNHPLRYNRHTYYQASFAENDTVSIFQVVKNPGWLFPYLACIIISFGLILQSALSIRQAKRKIKEASQ